MRLLILLHRWLGIACCALFAMWFASGMVLHFVPFPTLTNAERLAGLSPLQQGQRWLAMADAAATLKPAAIHKVRLLMRADRAQYVFDTDNGLISLYADTGERAQPLSPQQAMRLAYLHARQRGLNTAAIAYAELSAYDQWSVPNALDAYRPLHRIALNDRDGTELYVSNVTGEIVLDTTQFERRWNYVGAVVHWIYPTALRMHWKTWDSAVWWIALVALVVAISGLALGLLRAQWRSTSLSPFRGMLFWHHTLGLGCAFFIIPYILSGWLSMDHGLLFSRNSVSQDEIERLAGGHFEVARFTSLPADLVLNWHAQHSSTSIKQIDFVQLAGKAYARVRLSSGQQWIIDRLGRFQPAFDPENFNLAGLNLGKATECGKAIAVGSQDAYYSKPDTSNMPVYRIVCRDSAETWFHADGGSGQLMEKIDRSRRWYRWLYQGLHTLDISWLQQHAALRTWLTLVFCTAGLLFSLTGMVIGWRRLTK